MHVYTLIARLFALRNYSHILWVLHSVACQGRTSRRVRDLHIQAHSHPRPQLSGRTVIWTNGSRVRLVSHREMLWPSQALPTPRIVQISLPISRVAENKSPRSTNSAVPCFFVVTVENIIFKQREERWIGACCVVRCHTLWDRFQCTKNKETKTYIRE